MQTFLDWRVLHVMTRDVVTVDPELPLRVLQERFDEHEVNAFPVVDGQGTLLGVVTKLDLLRAYRFEPDQLLPPMESVQKTPVAQLMHADCDTATPMQPLTRVIEALLRTGHKSLPVVEDRRVVGIIAREDVLDALSRALQGEAPPIPDAAE